MEEWIGASVDCLYGYAHSLTENHEEARDLAHDSIVRAMESPHAPNEAEGYKAWILRILRNRFIDLRRRTGVVLSFGLPDDIRAADDFDWVADQRAIDVITVKLVLAKLDIAQREIVVLVDCVGCTHAEAAKVLEIPEGTAMSRLFRARKASLDLIEAGNVTPLRREARSGGAGR